MRKSEIWLSGLLFLGLLLFLGRMGLELAFSLDEFTYAHAAWLISRGEAPYRDFALLHPPLLEILAAPSFLLFREALPALLAIRLGCVGLLLGALFLFERFNEARAPRGITAFLAAIFGVFPTWMLEIRPDSLALALTLCGIWCAHRGKVALAGALIGSASFASEKVFIYGLALPLAFLFFRRSSREFWRLTVAGLGTALLLYGGLLLWSGGGPVRLFFVDWALAHELRYFARSPWKQLAPHGIEFSLLALLSASGIVLSLSRGWRLLDGMLLLLLLLGALSYGMQRGPYPYSLLPALAPMLIFASRNFLLASRILFEPIGGIVLLLLTYVFPLPGSERNHQQRVLLGTIEERIAPEACVYDNTGTAVTRPHPLFYFFTDSLMREIFRESFLPEALPKIERCAAIIIDKRFSELPPEFQQRLRERFPNCPLEHLCFADIARDAPLSWK